MPVYALGDLEPDIHPDAYVHPDAVVIADHCLISSGSVVLNGFRVDDGAIVAAGKWFRTELRRPDAPASRGGAEA